MEKNKIMKKGQSSRNSIIKIKRFSVGLILIGMFFLNGCKKNTTEDLGTFTDPKVALIETHKALTLLSKNLNKGYESASYLTEYETTKDKIFNVE